MNKILFTLLILTLTGCNKSEKTKHTALVTTFHNHVQYHGKVLAAKQQAIQSPTDGIIKKIEQHPGLPVKKGDLIVTIESDQAGQLLLSNLSKKQSLDLKYQQDFCADYFFLIKIFLP